MNIISVVILVALVFGVCYLADKCFARLFRSRPQHQSGLAVRAGKRYPLVGIVLMVLGVAAVFQGGILRLGGAIVILIGLGLTVYYLGFGVFYSEDSFLVCSLGKKNREYAFRDIQSQQLYLIAGGNVVVELQMADGTVVSLQTIMDGAYPFLDHAFAAWCRQTETDPESCAFHDPANCCWFPPAQETEPGEDR